MESLFCRRGGRITSVKSDREASITWTPSPRDRNQNTCIKERLSELDERLTLRHEGSQGAPDLHQSNALNDAVDTIKRPRLNPMEDHQGRTRGHI